MMSSLIGGFSFLFIYAYFIIPLAPIVYIFIKWRSYRDGDPPDPQLGMKVILYYFKTLAYHVFLASLAILFYGLVKNTGSSIVHVGLGLLVSSVIIYLTHCILIHKLTNTADFPLTARIYTGLNLVIVGLVGMISFVITLVTLFEKGFEKIELPLVCFIVYAVAWVLQTAFFCKPSLAKKISPFHKRRMASAT